MDLETLLLKTMSSEITPLVLLCWVVWRVHLVEGIVKKLVERCPMCTEKEKGSITAMFELKGKNPLERERGNTLIG